MLHDVGDVVQAAELVDFEGLTRCRFEMCVAFGVVGARMVVRGVGLRLRGWDVVVRRVLRGVVHVVRAVERVGIENAGLTLVV